MLRKEHIDDLGQDVRYGLRVLRRDRTYAATVVLTLAICLAANAAIFTVVRSVLQRPLPYPDAGRLVYSFDSFPGVGVERAGTSVPNYVDRLALTDAFDSVALYQASGYRVGDGTTAERVAAMNVTPSFFTVLRTSAAHGRVFTDAEGTEGHDAVVVVSHAWAAQQPGGAATVVGRQLRVDDRPYAVVGVLPKTFTFLNPDVAMYVPLAFTAEDRAEERRYSQNHDQIARLAANATIAQAQARVDALNAGYFERAGALRQLLVDARFQTRLVPFGADVVRGVRPALGLLWGGALFVLLIAAVNITNLSLVRASGRLKDIATRNAVGASAGRIARQLVTEALLLTLIGGVLGLAFGYWSLSALTWLGLADMPRAHEIHVDGTVFAVTLGFAAVLGIIVGLVPAAHVMRANLAETLRDEGRSGTASHRTRMVRRGLVVAQVSLAFVLIAGSGLLLASFQKLLGVDPGFVADRVHTVRVAPLESRYPDENALRQYASRTLERIRALPGVESAGITSFVPFSDTDSSSTVLPEGYTPKAGESVISPRRVIATPGYLETLQVRLVRGRLFSESDSADAPRVVVIDEQLAHRFWPGVDPVGRRLYQPSGPQDVLAPGPNTIWMHVIGVVKSVKMKGLVEEGETSRIGAYYQAFAQSPERGIGFVVASRRDDATTIASVRRALGEIDPELQGFDALTMRERIERSLGPRRAPLFLSIAFGCVALLLASVGLYGVLAYQVSQRTREFGIRLALGSRATGILVLVLREGAGLVGLGLVGGIVGAWALRGVIASQLYGVGPLDPIVMLVVIAVLAMVAILACIGPARRAALVNPLVALTRN